MSLTNEPPLPRPRKEESKRTQSSVLMGHDGEASVAYNKARQRPQSAQPSRNYMRGTQVSRLASVFVLTALSRIRCYSA